MIVLGAFMMLASTVVGAVLVEAAQGAGASGRLPPSLRRAVRMRHHRLAVRRLPGDAVVWLDGDGLRGRGVPRGAVALLFLKRKPVTADAGEMIAEAGRHLKRIGSAGTMWAAGGLIALFYIAPGFSTALFYRQQDLLHMRPTAQGYLTTCAALSAIAGRRSPTRSLAAS